MTSKSGLWKIDWALFARYGFGRAYRIALQHRATTQSGVSFAYGETPRKTTQTLLEMMQLQPSDRFVELGSGIGRMTLYASQLYGVSATGIEAVQRFVDGGNEISAKLHLRDCTFTQGDIFDHNWESFSVLYLMMTTFPDDTLNRVQQKCDTLRSKTKLITVTHPINHHRLKQTELQVLDFSWGPATVFVHQVLPP